MEKIVPLEFKVMILVDKVDDMSSGGMYLPEQARDREQYANDRGTIVSVSPDAFKNGGFDQLVPEVGDRVMFNKYAGTMHRERKEDREYDDYRIVNDTDIIAILRKEEKDG